MDKTSTYALCIITKGHSTELLNAHIEENWCGLEKNWARQKVHAKPLRQRRPVRVKHDA